MSTATEFREPALPVFSRVSWGAILAGAAIAFAVNILLTWLGVAVGLTVADDGQLGTGAAIWAIVVVILSLFAGGCVSSMFTVGENKTEAVIYGAILWGVSFILMFWMFGFGVRLGFSTMMAGDAAATTAGVSDAQLAAIGREAGLTDAEIARLQAAAPQQAQAVAVTQDDVTAAAWWVFAGILLSMLAAIGGSLVGAAVPVERRWRGHVIHTTTPGHPAVG